MLLALLPVTTSEVLAWLLQLSPGYVCPWLCSACCVAAGEDVPCPRLIHRKAGEAQGQGDTGDTSV